MFHIRLSWFGILLESRFGGGPRPWPDLHPGFMKHAAARFAILREKKAGEAFPHYWAKTLLAAAGYANSSARAYSLFVASSCLKNGDRGNVPAPLGAGEQLTEIVTFPVRGARDSRAGVCIGGWKA